MSHTGLSGEKAMAKQTKILIVEDDPDTAEMLRAYFEAEGYDTLAAAWGNDALRICREVVPDLIIQDVRLPDMDGYTVVQQLRENLRTSRVPIIFLTERKGHDDKITGLKLGAVDYLTKPFDMQELRLRVRNALRRASYASLVSPVTGLPGQQVTEEWLRDLGGRDQWAVIYISVSGIDSFNEAYGFVAGDDVLRAVGLIVSHVVDEIGTLEDQIGHTTKSSFVLVTQESRAQQIRDELAARLGRAFNYFYPIKDVESGHIAAPMKAEVGIVAASSGPFDTPSAVLDAAIQARQTVATGRGASV
jgi:PleD family two-component response regulator